MARIDHDKPHAALETRHGGGRVGQTRGAGVVAPQNETTRVGDIGHGAVPAAKRHTADAKSIAGGETAAPSADLNVAARMGVQNAFIKRRMKPSKSAMALVEGNNPYAEGDALRPAPLGDPAHGGCGGVQRIIPS